MQESRLWLLNHIGNAFTINTNQNQFRQLKNTYNEAVTVKRVSASDSCGWAIGQDHRVYIYVFSSDVPIRVADTTYENQRWNPIHGYSRKSLLPTDRNAWSDAHGIGDRPKESVRLPSGYWQWEGDWFIDDNLRGEVVGIEGWQYALDFPSVYSPDKHWNSFVRKRKWIRFRNFVECDMWARISDIEVADKAECFIDISVGGFLMPTRSPRTLSVWGVTNDGNIYVRTNTHHNNPEGDSWQEIELCKQNGVINISVGVSNLVWAITWDGNAIVRTNVTRNNIYGTGWELVEYPNETTRLMQVAVGHNAVWALSREGKIWFRKGTWGDDIYGNVQSSVGTGWVEMVGEMMHLAVSADDQVFAIDKNTREIVFRTSVTRTDLTGKSWQVITLQEDISLLEKEGRMSVGIICSCSDDGGSICESHRNSQTYSRSSSCSLTQMNSEDSSSDVFIQSTKSYQGFQLSSEVDNIGEKSNRLSPHQQDSRIPFFSIASSDQTPDSSMSSSDTSLVQVAISTDDDQFLPGTTLIQTELIQNPADCSRNEGPPIIKEKTINTSPSHITTAPSFIAQSTSSQDSENSKKDPHEKDIAKKGEEMTNCLEVCEDDHSLKEGDHHSIKRQQSKNIKKKHHRKSDGQMDSSSSIVYQKKKDKSNHKPLHSKSLIDSTHSNCDDSSLRDTEISDNSPASMPSISIIEIDDTSQINTAPTDCLNKNLDISKSEGCLEEPNYSAELPSENSSDSFQESNVNEDSPDHANRDVQDALSFILSVETPSEKKEEIVVEAVEQAASVQMNIQYPSVSDSSTIPVQKDSFTKRSQYIYAPSSSLDSSSVSDEIIDFVTDLVSDEDDEQDVIASKETAGRNAPPKDFNDGVEIKLSSLPFSHEQLNKQISREDSDSSPSYGQSPFIISRHSDQVESPSSQPDEEMSQHSSCVFSHHQQGLSTGRESSCSESSSATIQMYTMEMASSRVSWKWMDVTSCLIGNPSTVPWLINRSQGSNSKNKTLIKISPMLRNDILGKLKDRNKQEFQPFSNIERAIDKKTWVKCTKMHVYLYGHHNCWMSCNVELEQGISDSKGCLTVQYSHKISQKQIKVNHNEIICVKMSPNLDDRSTFFIYSSIADVIYKPLMLRTASESEALEWMGYLCLANAHSWNIDRPISPGVAWSCTTAGDVFVSVDSCNNKASDLCWGQHGGHMSLIETGPSGVTWALGFDQVAYVYNSGYGGSINVGMTGMSGGLQEMTDFDKVYVYENQKWFPVVGWCNKGVLNDDFHWLTPSGKSVESKDDIKLPSSKWQWLCDWTVDFNSPGGVDTKGWQFSSNLSGHFHSRKRMGDTYRRRRWSRTSSINTHGPWQAAGSLKLLDISVQIDPVSSHTDPIVLWAVGTNGNVICRSGVTMTNPEGESWKHIATFLDKPYRSISVGGGYRVWGIASDGSAWYRSNVSQHNHSGKCWLQVVPPPPGNSLLKQVSAGATSVWAVDTEDNLWRREHITPTFPEGTGWDLVATKVKRVSVGPQDQVWIVAGSGFSRIKHGSGVIYNRGGISEKRPSGTDWKAVIGPGWSHASVRGMSASL